MSWEDWRRIGWIGSFEGVSSLVGVMLCLRDIERDIKLVIIFISSEFIGYMVY